MTVTTKSVSEEQRRFGLAVCERLGLDPSIVVDDLRATAWGGDDLSPVTLTVYLPTDDVIRMMLDAGVRPKVTP